MSQSRSRANSAESQRESVLTDIVDLTEMEADEIPETQQSTDPAPSAPENEGPTASTSVLPRFRKRNAPVDPSDGGNQRPKRKAARHGTLSDAPPVGTIGLEDLSHAATLQKEFLSLKEEVTSSKRDVKELTQKLENQRTVVTALTQANEILGNRFRRLERSVEAGRNTQDDFDTAFSGQLRDYQGAVTALEESYNGIDGRIRGLMVDQKETIATQKETMANQNNTITALLNILNSQLPPKTFD